MSATTAIPTLPRWTGDHQSDLELIKRFLEDFHRTSVREAKLLDPAFQATPAAIVQTALPDPAATSIANAQNVANAAYRKAFGLPP